jgi:hypothetical protein
MPTHRIRLRGSWEVAALGDGRMRHARRFGRPRTQDANETVWLVCESVPGGAVVSLNGTVIGHAEAGQAFAFDVTGQLDVRNEVAIDVMNNAALGEVALEIRAPDGLESA